MKKLIPKHLKGNYMQTSTGKIANFLLPEVEVTGESPTGNDWEDRNRYKAYKGRRYISEGRLEAKPLALGLAGLTALPGITALAPAVSATLNNPYVNATLTADGVRNALSGEGILKTYKLAKEGDYWGATKSGVVDALDLYGGTSLIRKTGKTVGTIGKDVVAKLRHPTYKKYYHGSPTPFNIKEAWMGTSSDIGLHMGDKNVANRMAGKDGVIYDFYAPKPKLETIDNWNNDIELFTGNINLKARPKGEGNHYYASKYSTKWNDLLKKGDATFKQREFTPDFFDVNIEKDIDIPAKDVNWPNMPKNVENKLNIIRQNRDNRIDYLNDRYSIEYPEVPQGIEPSKFHLSKEYKDLEKLILTRNLRLGSLIYAAKVKANKDASKVLFDNGIDVVQYRNVNPSETSNMSYFLTDPSVIYQPKDYNIKGSHLFGAGILGGGILNTNNND